MEGGRVHNKSEELREKEIKYLWIAERIFPSNNNKYLYVCVCQTSRQPFIQSAPKLPCILLDTQKKVHRVIEK